MPRISLVSVYSADKSQREMYEGILYGLLLERQPNESISHKKMPTMREHRSFVDKKPYAAWYIIQSLDEKDYPFIGCIYLSNDDEIGISIFNEYRRQHYASVAINALMDEHPRVCYYANINPENLKSKELFKRLGFKYHNCAVDIDKLHIVRQETYIKIIGDET